MNQLEIGMHQECPQNILQALGSGRRSGQFSQLLTFGSSGAAGETCLKQPVEREVEVLLGSGQPVGRSVLQCFVEAGAIGQFHGLQHRRQ